MRKRWAWMLASTILVGGGWARARADDNAGPDAKPAAADPGSTSWNPIRRWLDGSSKDSSGTKANSADKTAQPASSPKSKAALIDQAMAERAREEADLLRRLKVCDRLREIAIQTNDEELMSQVAKLEERATLTYSQRTAYLRNFPDRDVESIDRGLASTGTAKKPGDASGTRTAALGGTNP